MSDSNQNLTDSVQKLTDFVPPSTEQHADVRSRQASDGAGSLGTIIFTNSVIPGSVRLESLQIPLMITAPLGAAC